MPGPRTRIAPTPSGYLHVGNAWSFVLAWLLARGRGGSVHLRIDDLDAARLRPEYLEDIFDSLRWLGLDWDTGPRDAEDFRAHHSQRLRLDRYREALDRLARADGEGHPAVFACACTREQAKRAAEAAGTPGLYPGTCRGKGLAFDKPGTSLRLRVPAEAACEAKDLLEGIRRWEPARDMGDFVVRQKNGDPAYQLASVIDDEDLGIDCVVRGMDLLPSTGAQLFLARRLGARTFLAADFLHHNLWIAEGEEGKLSKSSLGSASESFTLRSLRGTETSAPLYRAFARQLGLAADGVEGPRDLLAGFDPAKLPTGPLLVNNYFKGT